MKGKLYLIPSPLGELAPIGTIPSYVLPLVNGIRHYIVEDERTARRYLKRLGIATPIDDLTFYVIDKHSSQSDHAIFLKPTEEGHDIGLISDAGCPGIADPGAEFVSAAHKKGIIVSPLVGPSSILMAMMASGFNGQDFHFNGYIPIEKGERIKMIKEKEKEMLQSGASQIFIETPYRNGSLLDDLLKNCAGSTLLCIACDITTQAEYIACMKISEWKNKKPDLNKRPAIFILGK